MNFSVPTPSYNPQQIQPIQSVASMLSFKEIIQNNVDIPKIREKYTPAQLYQFQQELLSTPIEMQEPFDVITTLNRVSLLPLPSSFALSYSDIAPILIREGSNAYPSIPLVQSGTHNIPIDINPNQVNYMISIGQSKFCREGLDRTIDALKKTQVYMANENALRFAVQQQFWKNPTYPQRGIDFLNVLEKLQTDLRRSSMNKIGDIARECAEAQNKTLPKCTNMNNDASFLYDFPDGRLCQY